MASILQFIPRQPSSPNWSDDERSRLYEFASAMAESCGVRIDFGQTDEGDPWCVVLDDNEDVLVHIARIDGTFVAHAVAQDLVAQATELSAALDRAIGARPGDRADVVIPFPSNRSSQIVTAVLVAAAISWGADSEAHEPLAVPGAGDGDGDAPTDRRNTVTVPLPVDLLIDLGRTPSPDAPGPAMPAYGTPRFVAVETAVEAAIVPAAPASEPWGGLGPGDPEAAMPLPDEPAYVARQIGGAPTPQPTIELPSPLLATYVVGTNDDDSLLVGGSTIVSGGAGADRFIIASPPAAKGQPLGIILDFSVTEGDTLQLMSASGSTAGFAEPMPQTQKFGPPAAEVEASILSVQAVADIRPDATPGQPPVEGVRLGIDFDGDGGEDGFLLLGGVSEADAVHVFGPPPAHPSAPFSASDAPVIVAMPPEPDPPVATTFIG